MEIYINVEMTHRGEKERKKSTKKNRNLPALHAVHETFDITLVSISCATCFKLNNFNVLSTNGG